MSAETDANLGVVRRMYDAFATADFDTVLALAADDIVVDQCDELPWGGHYEGHEALGTFRLTLAATSRSTGTHEQRFAAGDRVIQVGRTAGTTVATGAPFDIPEVHVWTLRDGRITHFEAYIDTPPMLEALHA